MRLTRFELKKAICTPVVWAVLFAVTVLDIFSALAGGNPLYAPAYPGFRANIQSLQERRAYFAGPITQTGLCI